MKLTPLDILQREFRRKAFNGLDPEDVEQFLMRVAEGVEELLVEIADLRRQIERAERAGTAAARASATDSDTAVSTTRSRGELNEALENARNDARWIREQAQIEAQRILSDARETREALDTADIRRMTDDYRLALEDQLARLGEIVERRLSTANLGDSDARAGTVGNAARQKESVDDGTERRA